MFARNLLNSFFRNNNISSLMITRSQLKTQIPLSNSLTTGSGDVHHSAAEKLFYINLKDEKNEKAYIKYRQKGNVITLLTTQVPKEQQGRGLGKILAKVAFDYAVANNLKMEIKCEFLRGQLEKYGQHYKSHVIQKK